MPLYEYKCKFCDITFEVMQSIKEIPQADCLICNSTSNERLISAGGNFVLRGEGWAKDNYSKTK